MGYYLEGLILLLIFAKQYSYVTLTGITNHPKDLSIDTIRNTTVYNNFKIVFSD
jgi:RNA 3'-terminal phosphate cyclase-like protein